MAGGKNERRETKGRKLKSITSKVKEARRGMRGRTTEGWRRHGF